MLTVFLDFSPEFGLLSFYVYLYLCRHRSIVISSLTGELHVGCLILWVGTQALFAVDFELGSIAVGAQRQSGLSSRAASIPKDEALSQRPTRTSCSYVPCRAAPWTPSLAEREGPPCGPFRVRRTGGQTRWSSQERRNQAGLLRSELCHRHRAGPPRVL